MENISLDSTDKSILRMLQHNSKLTNKEVAARLNMTITPIYERIKRLEQNKVIERYRAVINKEQVGRPLLVFCDVSVKEHSSDFLQKFEADIKKLVEVMDCYHIGGSFDYLLKVSVRDMHHYQDFISNKLAALENIGNVRSSFVMKEIKSNPEFVID